MLATWKSETQQNLDWESSPNIPVQMRYRAGFSAGPITILDHATNKGEQIDGNQHIVTY
jgi:hypothetical protein